MPAALSLHLGLDRVDGLAYGGWTGALRSCERDARAMQALADAAGFRTRLLLAADATYPRLCAELTGAATLGAGDHLLITFAGHGASFQNLALDGDPAALDDEADQRDEAWCLYDGFVLDDELHAALVTLPAGVRVLVVSDSCFSGTVTRPYDPAAPAPTPPDAVRGAPAAIARAHHHRHYPRYAARKTAARAAIAQCAARAAIADAGAPGAQVILLAACQDQQGAREQGAGGVFTERLLAVWDRGRFTGSHRDFRDAIAAAMPPTQQPNLDVTDAPDRAFVEARPFTPG